MLQGSRGQAANSQRSDAGRAGDAGRAVDARRAGEAASQRTRRVRREVTQRTVWVWDSITITLHGILTLNTHLYCIHPSTSTTSTTATTSPIYTTFPTFIPTSTQHITITLGTTIMHPLLEFCTKRYSHPPSQALTQHHNNHSTSLDLTCYTFLLYSLLILHRLLTCTLVQ